MRRVSLLCLLTSVLLVPVALGACQDHHGSGDQRAAKAMGFDPAQTQHHFLLFSDGGAIDVSEGNFDAPMLVHDST